MRRVEVRRRARLRRKMGFWLSELGFSLRRRWWKW